MSSRQFALPDGINVEIVKRSSSRNLRLTISNDGRVRVSIPKWAAYKTGYDFALSKLDWIKKSKPSKDNLINGQAIGKSHHLVLMQADVQKISTRVKGSEAVVAYPRGLASESPEVQKAASLVSKRALKKQAENLLPQRLKQLAADYGYNYSSVRVKPLKSRWGSCDYEKNIILNIYLMLLPWDLIDYVCLHELSHTVVMKHGEDFWLEVGKSRPNHKQLRKELRSYRAII